MNAVKGNLLMRLLKRRNLSGLMELYEINHRLLGRLIPGLAEVGDEAVSRVPGSPDLHLRVRERCRFTTTLSLTYYFAAAATGPEGRGFADPDLQIRIYHDARLVEAMPSRGEGGPPGDQVRAGRRNLVDRRWGDNLFLEKWLAYTLAQGHCFGARGVDRGREDRVIAPLQTL